MSNLKKIVVVGGGSAGWMAAASLANMLNGKCRIELIESDEIGIIGVGEATIPPIKLFNRTLGIGEKEFMQATQGTFKLGIDFHNWGEQKHRYFHPFGQFGADFDKVALHQYWIKERKSGLKNELEEYSFAWGLAKENKFTIPQGDRRMVQSTFDYAYHFDASLYAKFLRKYSEERGVKRIEGKVIEVNLKPSNGFIDSLCLENGETVSGDFFIDCSGFRGLLIEQALETGYQHWDQYLPCDRAVAIPCENGGEFTPHTRSTAHDAGWQWRIPLQHRIGNGYVYCSKYKSDEDALKTLMSNLDGKPLAEPRFIRFNTGRRNKFWNKNCLALGLAAGFMEPLESTSLHLVQSGITRFLALFPDDSFNVLNEQEYNRITTEEYERIRDFLILHYYANSRTDSEFWQDCARMDIPKSLQYKLDHFRANGRLVSEGPELFVNSNWLAVMLGQKIYPERYDPLVDERNHIKGKENLASLKKVIDETVAAMPSHKEFIQKYCPSRNE